MAAADLHRFVENKLWPHICAHLILSDEPDSIICLNFVILLGIEISVSSIIFWEFVILF